MSSGNDPNSDPDAAKDPYEMLGLDQGASFDLIQKARDQRLSEAGEDPKARAEIESSYDILLMASLKNRQLGKVSNAAVTASQREAKKNKSVLVDRSAPSLFSKANIFSKSNIEKSSIPLLPELSLPEGSSLNLRIAIGFLLLIITLFAPSDGIQLILSIATISTIVSQIRRGRKFFPALGWSVVLLSIGLIAGGILVGGISSINQLHIPIEPAQLEALPAIILLWWGLLFFT